MQRVKQHDHSVCDTRERYKPKEAAVSNGIFDGARRTKSHREIHAHHHLIVDCVVPAKLLRFFCAGRQLHVARTVASANRPISRNTPRGVCRRGLQTSTGLPRGAARDWPVPRSFNARPFVALARFKQCFCCDLSQSQRNQNAHIAPALAAAAAHTPLFAVSQLESSSESFSFL